ncbi:LpqB family beta-propeller domain-containing protein [Luteipulveratus sp. YIM 133132]|uniref:GerMN domain-containing protein n=1 Tax=Luteipulveratus flavus TaxID=3031728 RepID=UPI0023AEF0ED|nr:LpqB family beta-propeller domain-containing protein [Luteipulveratus sp. YIM 133132]MDE9367724.1 LpqB family beta-propeller domain-containing protein [Luteipulveratus sp. YIM 133132]
MKRLLVLLLAVLTLTGCAGLPDHSEVSQRMAIGEPRTEPQSDVRPEGPTPGATPAQVAAGFLYAHIGLEDRFATAQEFLTARAVQTWNPDQGVAVLRDGPLSVRQEGTDVVIGATVLARVSPDGRLSQLRTPQATSVRLRMAQVAGDWRVSGVPQELGLWLSRANFGHLYQPSEIYYGAKNNQRVLVPDERWLPKRGSVTAMAEAVLSPPAPWLDGAVQKIVPSPHLIGSVPVSADEIASVAISAEALKATPDQRAMLWAAMIETLKAAGVRVRLTVNGTPLAAPGVSDDVVNAEDLNYRAIKPSSGSVIVKDADGLHWDDQRRSDTGRPRQRDTADDLGPLPTVPTGWHRLAADFKTQEIAAVSGDDRTVGRWITGTLLQRPPFGSHLVRPSYDGINGLWVAGQALGTDQSGARGPAAGGAPTVWVINTRQQAASAQPQPVVVPGLAGRDVLAISVAPDGQRLAVVLRDRRTSTTSVQLYGVVRNQEDEATRLVGPRPLNASVVSATDISWVDGSTIAVLGQVSGNPGATQAVLVPLNDLAQPLGAVRGAQQIVGGTGDQFGVSVVTDQGTVVGRQGTSWQVIYDADDLIVPAP